MSKISLDLSKFKHVKSDKHTTTLRHKDGHMLTVAHGSLGKDGQAQLKALASDEEKPKYAEGGEVDSSNLSDEDKKKNKKKNQESGETLDYSAIKKEYYEKNKSKAAAPDPIDYKQLKKDYIEKGKKLADEDRFKKKYAEGGEVDMSNENDALELPQNSIPMSLAKNDPPRQPWWEISSHPEEPQTLLTPAIHSLAEDASLKTQQAAEEVSNFVNPDQNKLSPPPTQGPNGQIAPPAMARTPQASIQQPFNQGLEGRLSGMERGLQQETAGLAAEQRALGEAGKQKAALQEQYRLDAEEANKQFTNNFNTLADEGKALKADIISGHLDPQRYINNMSTGNKIATGIGLILGGIGAGLTHQPNMAMEYLNKQIDNDLMAQKAELGKKENLLAYTTQQMGNLKDGYQAAKLYNLEILNSRMQQIVDQTQDPIAKARVQQVLGQGQQKAAEMHFKLSQAMTINQVMNQARTNPTATGPAEALANMLEQTDPERAKIVREKIVPGVGVATIPVPQDTRNKMVSHQKFEHSLDDLQNFVNNNSTKLRNPLDPAYNQGLIKVRKLQSEIRENLLGTVYKEGEQPLLDAFINLNPAGIMKNFQTNPQIKELRHLNENDFNILKESVGISGGKSNPQDGRSKINFKPQGR